MHRTCIQTSYPQIQTYCPANDLSRAGNCSGRSPSRTLEMFAEVHRTTRYVGVRLKLTNHSTRGLGASHPRHPKAPTTASKSKPTMFLRRSAVALSRQVVVKPIAARTFTSSFLLRKPSPESSTDPHASKATPQSTAPKPGEPDARVKPFEGRRNPRRLRSQHARGALT